MDRGYMGSDGKEIQLAADAVTGLIRMNVNNNDGSADKLFIKALMIAIGPLKMFHSVNSISKKEKDFIKGNLACIFHYSNVCDFDFVSAFNLIQSFSF